MDKATLPKVTNAHAAGNHVISVRTRLSLARLLDFTQDINLLWRLIQKDVDEPVRVVQNATKVINVAAIFNGEPELWENAI
ncbi:hypothetical protein KIW84_023775 [Lathyrus oleraceus]|uniref:Uncharacterized protein n=1 Tax=Pisum sativum TaxID=3888 RepID=A0A9D5BBK9_PEA|nr:hypothetical protein KIW84_023775 [Pisum sativum]